jgi:hypothetical protein
MCRTVRTFAKLATASLALASGAGCATLAPPFDKMKDSQMTVYRLQNFEPPVVASAQPAAAPLALPPQIQQWVQAGASLLPPGLLPPGLLQGGQVAPPPPAPDAPRFHGFRILEWQPVNDPGVKGDIVDVFGRASSFHDAPAGCMYAEFGFAIAQPGGAPPADLLVSLSCEQVQAYNFTWPYAQTAMTADASKKIVSVAQRIFARP